MPSFPQESDTCSITRCVDQMFAEAQMTQDEHINYHKPATRPWLTARRRSVANRAPRTRQFERGAEPQRSMCQLTCTATTCQVSVRQGRVCAARRASERKGSHAKSFSPAQSRALLAASAQASSLPQSPQVLYHAGAQEASSQRGCQRRDVGACEESKTATRNGACRAQMHHPPCVIF